MENVFKSPSFCSALSLPPKFPSGESSLKLTFGQFQLRALFIALFLCAGVRLMFSMAPVMCFVYMFLLSCFIDGKLEGNVTVGCEIQAQRVGECPRVVLAQPRASSGIEK